MQYANTSSGDEEGTHESVLNPGFILALEKDSLVTLRSRKVGREPDAVRWSTYFASEMKAKVGRSVVR